MDHTRSGRKVKRSSRFLDMEEDFNQYEVANVSGDDGDYNMEDDNSSDCSVDDMNGDDEDLYSAPRQSSRVINKQFSSNIGGLTWKNGVLVPSQEPAISLPPLKTRQKQKSTMSEDTVPRINVVKDDPATRFYSSAVEALKNPNLSYPSITNKTIDNSDELNGPPIDLIKDERFRIKLEPKTASLIPKYDKSNDKISEIVGVPLSVSDLKRYSRLTGHILLSIVGKRSSGVAQRAQQQDGWASMPERTKRDWEIRAKQVKKLVDNKRRNDAIEDGAKKERRRSAMRKAEESIKKAKVTEHNLSDLAFYLKTVSDGMSRLSTKVAALQGTVQSESVASLMLDYLLCSFVSLAGIFEESEGLDKTVTSDSLNKLTFVVPGLNA